MIHDSHPWKTQLARDANLIERWAAKPRRSERRSFLIEQKVFLAAYTMRKLDDAAKTSTDLLASSMSVSRFPSTRAGFSGATSHRFDDFFDLKMPARVDLRRRRLLDLLIHSVVFVEVLCDAETYDAFLVTSDYEQAKGLVQVEIAAFVDLMRLAATDHPTAIRRTLDSSTGQWRIWTGQGDPPSD